MKKIIFLFLSCASLSAQVGINTTTPTRTLDVNGNLRVRTQTNQSANAVYDNVQIADANGNVDYIKKNVLNQQMVQLFSLNTLALVNTGGDGTAPVSISNQSITLIKPAFVIINFSVPITLSTTFSDVRLKLLRTHLSVNGTNVVRASNTYTNGTNTGNNLSGIFYNTGSYITLLGAGTHSIEILGTCFDLTATQCIQGGNYNGTLFQAFAMYNDF
ncbi:hypothetical protein ACM46_17935 [Chryseobacterium angstadtii]|uniref:Uncharacterized protein n=1 Tax=Chryseobacterium angstadtii TaxID=558151 RepID=A0A0J7KSF9_9FLAO|nr:hypothetical protein [Chryseobacterium angstadtii]KMQ60120.1 hypothetical protein ACM46_17935 [Chryseobacterium angstadtii]